jgi:hypothetical protein
MFNNVALDVFIGLVFIFLLYSLLASIIQEMIATRLAFRAKVLEKAIVRMLEDGQTTSRLRYGDRLNGFLHLLGLKNILKYRKIAPWFFAHPLIKYLAEDNFYSKPAYLNASNFSKVILDLLKGLGKPESEALLSIHNALSEGVIHKLPINISQDGADKANPAIKVLRDQHAILPQFSMPTETVPLNPNTAIFLRSLWQDAGADVESFRRKLEQWFDDTMERATGWYKKYVRILLFIIGLVIAYLFNVDTIAIKRILATNKTAREQLVQMAISRQGQLGSLAKSVDTSGTVSDSMLWETYNHVADDAREAGSILGLGKPWKDTCRLCKDSLNEGFSNRFNALKCQQKAIADSIISVKHAIHRLSDERKMLISGPLNSSNRSTISQLNHEITVDSNRLASYASMKFPEYERMKSLHERCAYIHAQQSKTLFLYSPLQRGGWETILGWIITASAIMLGAPFWFDLLAKLISLRGTGTKISASGSNDYVGSAGTAATPVNVSINTNSGEEPVG